MKKISFVFLILFLTSCSATGPVLYPNTHLQKVGEVQAQKDVAACEVQANQYVKSDAGIEAAEKYRHRWGRRCGDRRRGRRCDGQPGAGYWCWCCRWCRDGFGAGDHPCFGTEPHFQEFHDPVLAGKRVRDRRVEMML